MKKKGFTLIELLAVIVILAIIALIATPVILGVVENARKGAAKSSALGYIDAVEKQMMINELSDKNAKIINGVYDVPLASTYGVKVKGQAPTSGWLEIANNKVERYSFVIGKYVISYDGTNKTAVKGDTANEKPSGSSEPVVVSGATKVDAQAGETHKGIVYLNPTNISAECNASNSTSTTETKTGCMKWYIFDDSGDNYTMILDHNTTALVAYETSGTYKEYAQASIKNQVDTDTTGWTAGLNPRLITADEIASITNTSTFDGSSGTWFYFDGTGNNKKTQASSSQGASPYSWLFDYTNGCTSYGCNAADSSTYGYWTSSPVSDISKYAWFVDYDGYLSRNNVVYGFYYGVRPVISVSKSRIS